MCWDKSPFQKCVIITHGQPGEKLKPTLLGREQWDGNNLVQQTVIVRMNIEKLRSVFDIPADYFSFKQTIRE